MFYTPPPRTFPVTILTRCNGDPWSETVDVWVVDRAVATAAEKHFGLAPRIGTPAMRGLALIHI